ncbi:hypothetical protein I6F36_11360 [Bradyrhizobium sp. BRP19]|uniref:hypothetical protein n=1 Tax=Bradyrhizobium sp. BRP19 TaxID=2793823 RepID=UPI001CD4D939|nr:hypothetical protein [Bradyrhizobium sp. BRP19]MCA1547413.1 hypothetical protein [Bradyrhizobium sp. BRP19]
MADARTNPRSASIAAIRRYLQLRDWKETATKNDAITLFYSTIEGEQLEIPLPTHRDFEGAERLISDALRTLSQLADRDAAELADDINALGFDRIRSIIPDEQVRADSIDLNVATNFILNARRLVTATATNELEPSTFYGRITKDAVAYTDRCRFGHTFRGSFGFTIESPVIQNDEPPLPGMAQTPPFERRVIQRLVRGLHDVQKAEASENPGIIAENYERGFNANMCEALVDLISGTSDRLAIQVAWSPEWRPSPDVSSAPVFHIKPVTVEIVRDAASSLRRAETAQEREILGKVIRLKSEHNPADLLDLTSPREIVIQWMSDEFGPLNVRVNLSPTDYIAALEAHRTGHMISVTGMLERINRTWILSSPKNVQIQF